MIIHAAGLIFSGQGYTGISRVPALENLCFLELERASFFISEGYSHLIQWMDQIDELNPIKCSHRPALPIIDDSPEKDTSLHPVAGLAGVLSHQEGCAAQYQLSLISTPASSGNEEHGDEVPVFSSDAVFDSIVTILQRIPDIPVTFIDNLYCTGMSLIPHNSRLHNIINILFSYSSSGCTG